MTDVQPDPKSSGSDAPMDAPSARENDPLRGLYKMSTTAGLGSADYVAINWLSVLAFLLGLASLLSLAGLSLLVVPLAAILCAVLALWQIQTSNGTQSGRLLAIGGLALALVFGGIQIVRTVQQRAREKADEQQLSTIINELAQTVKSRDYEKAYTLFSDRFTQRVSKNEFIQKWKPLEDTQLLGALKSIEGNGEYRFDVDPTSDIRYGRTLLVLAFDKAQAPTRLDILFRHTGQKWVIEDMPSLFPPPQQGMPGAPPM